MNPQFEEPISSPFDARLPQPPYRELPPGVVAWLEVIHYVRTRCQEEDVEEVDRAILELLLPFRM